MQIAYRAFLVASDVAICRILKFLGGIALRPIALGRKNYLFAGSHEAAQKSAMIYSFFAIWKKHDVNPYQWLKYTLEISFQLMIKT